MNVTYLLGAGASIEAIPAVGEKFNERFMVFCQLLVINCRDSYPPTSKNRDFIERAIRELPKHYSVDTYARKLFFQNTNEYAAFKILLSSYFLFEQMGGNRHEIGFIDSTLDASFNKNFPYNRKKLDPRYDVLYAALLDEKEKQLPEQPDLTHV